MRRPGKEVSVLHCWWLTLGSHHLAPLLQRLAFRTRRRLGMQENLSPALQPECTGFSGKALLRRRREEEPREEGMLVYGLLTSRLCKEQQVPLNSLSEAETQDSIPCQVNAYGTMDTGWGTCTWIWLPGFCYERVEVPAPMWAGKGTKESLQPYLLANAEPGQTSPRTRRRKQTKNGTFEKILQHKAKMSIVLRLGQKPVFKNDFS